MEEWKEYKLGDISTMKYGKLPPSSESGKYPIWSGYRYVGMANTFNCAKGTLVVVARGVGGTGDVKIAKENCYLTNLSISVDIDTQICNPYFIYYKYLIKNLRYLDSGSAQSQITIDALKNLPIEIPSLAYQNKVVAILKSLDDKIEVNRRINDNLELQAQALFKSWFVDFEPFRDQPFVESELGMIPEGWRVGSFLDNINVMPGGTPSTNVDEYWKDGTIPFFSPKDVNGVYCFETEKSITELGLNNCSSRLYPKDTLFITARGTVGKIALAGVPMAMNQSNYALAAKEGVGKFYLYLLTQTLVSTLLKKANGAVFSAITTKDFNEPSLIPAENVMDSFEVLVKPIFDKMFQTCEESRRLAQLRDALLPRLMSGEIKVEDVTL